MRYSHLRARLFGVPLLLTPSYAEAITAGLSDKLGVDPALSSDEIQRYSRPTTYPVVDRETGIAVLPIVGAMVHRGDFMDAMSGVQSYARMQGQIQSLLDHRDVRGLLLDIDSGGGEGSGLEELVEFVKLQNQLGDKPIWGIANTCAASAAYWLASATDRLYIAPSASVGSIGVYVQHMDVSKAMAKRGIATSFVYKGAHKIDGNAFEPLPEGVRADIQKRVDELYTTFTAAVAANRDLDVEAVTATEARMYGPKDAIELGLADGEATLGEVLSVFADYVKPSLSGSTTGVKMTDRTTYTAGDVDRARAEGVKEGEAKANANVEGIRLEERKAVATAVTAIFKDDARADTFAEALNDGTSVATAQKFAMKHEGPKAEAPEAPEKTYTQADVDKMLKAHSPQVGDDEPEGDERQNRVASIREGMKAHNVSKGYVPRH